MTPRALLGLAIAGALALGGGWYFGTASAPPRKAAMDAGRLMFPDLTAKLKDVARIEITGKNRTTAIALKNGVWGLEDRGGYRVQETKLRGMLTALTELRLVEPRTSDPALFGRLGVEDPATEKEGTANLLRVLDAAGKPIVSVIAGHRRMRTQGNVPEQVYVRLPGDSQSWLAEGGLQADTDPQVWLDRDVINVQQWRVAKVVATRPAGTVELVRDGDKLKVTKPAEYPKLDAYKIDDVARALESLTFVDVKPATEPLGDLVGEAVFTTQDGLDIKVVVHRLDKDSWTTFSVTGTEKVKSDAEFSQARLAGWAFQTGAWKEKAFLPTIDDMKAAEEAKP